MARRYYHEFDLFQTVSIGARSVLTPGQVSVSIYTDSARTVLATVYSSADVAVLTTVSQPLSPDRSGNVSLYLAPGRMYYWQTSDGTQGEFFAPVPDGAAWVGAFTGATNTARVQAAFDSGADEVVFEQGLDITILDTTLPITVQTITAYGATVRHASIAGNGFGMFSKLTADGLGPLTVLGGTFVGVDGDPDDIIRVADSCFYLDTTTDNPETLDRITFRDCSFQDFQGYPLRIAPCHTVRLESCRFDNCFTGPSIYTPRLLWVTGCEFTGTPYTGLDPAPGLAVNCIPEPTTDTDTGQNRQLHITGNTFTGYELHQAILLHGAWYGTISHNLFEDCNAPISIHDNGTVGSYEGHRYLTILGNVFRGTDDYGDATHGDLYKHGGVTVYFNPAIEVTGNANSDALNVLIAHNVIMHYGWAAETFNAGDSVQTGAILSNGYTRNLEIRDNLIEDCYGAGINLKGKHQDLRITGNTFRDILDPSGQSGAGVRLLNGSPSGAVISGLIDNNWFDTVTQGVSASQTTPDFSALRIKGTNTFVAVTTPHAISTDANRAKTPLFIATATPVDVDASVTELLQLEVNSALTVNKPSNLRGGQRLQVTVYNPGSLGVITWNAVFKFQAAWTNPVGGAFRQITFVYDSTRDRLNEVSRTTADYA